MSTVVIAKEDSLKYLFYQSANEADLFIENDGLRQTIRFLDMESLDQMIDTLHSLRRMQKITPARSNVGASSQLNQR